MSSFNASINIRFQQTNLQFGAGFGNFGCMPGFSPFGNFGGLQSMFCGNQQQMLSGLLSLLAPRLDPSCFLSGQAGFQPQSSGSRVDGLLSKYGSDKKALAKSLGVSGSKDVKRIYSATQSLSQTPGPTVTFGGSEGVGGEKITIPADIANQIARAGSVEAGTTIMNDWLKDTAGTSDSRKILNQVMGTNIKKGKEKNAGSKLMLDTMVEQSVETIQSGRMLNLYGQPTCMMPCYMQNLQLDFGASQYDDAAKSVGSLASPLTLDLDGDGQLTSGEKTSFDIDGDGKLDTINDIDSGDAVLVFDADGDGVAGENGSELLGDNTDLDGDGKADGYADGFEALEAMARKEGLIGAGDSELSTADLQVLEKKYGLKIKKGSLNATAQSLSSEDIQSLNVGTGKKTFENNFDGQGNAVTRRQGATFTRTDGSSGGMNDIWFQR